MRHKLHPEHINFHQNKENIVTEERHDQITDLVIADDDNPNSSQTDTQEQIAQRTGIPLAELQEWFERSEKMVKDAEPLRKALQRLLRK